MLQETALIDAHRAAGAKLVDFGGWNMPLHYGSQIEEHHAVRRGAGMFDVSHMTVVDIQGVEARDYLHFLLANDVDKLKAVGKALYTGMLNDQGGVIDDLIVYRREDGYRAVVNCATREKDLAWMQRQIKDFDVSLKERPDLAMVAVQGPEARGKVSNLLGNPSLESLKPFSALELSGEHSEWMVARTGYTGEDGYEIILPALQAEGFWSSLVEVGVSPCGLGARDTLRLEAGMNLYGHEMDDDISPLVANMGWTIAWAPEDRNFIGRAAITAERDRGVSEKLVGLVLEGRGVLRAGQKVQVEGLDQEGVVTSGTFSPTLGHSVALARVPVDTGAEAVVLIRDKAVPVKVVGPSFVRHGKPVF